MSNDWQLFIVPNGGSFHVDPLMSHQLGGHWLFRITSLVDNTRYIPVPGSLALQKGFDCVSKFAGALVLRFASGSNSTSNGKNHGDRIDSHSHCSGTSIQVKRISTKSFDLTRLFQKSKRSKKSSHLIKISSCALKRVYRAVENQLQSFPMLSLAAALVPPFMNGSANAVILPLETNGMKCIDQRPHDIENGDRTPYSELYFQKLDWSKTAVEPKTGIEFPTMLDISKSGDSTSIFTPEVLVGTGSRTMTIIRIKTLEIYAFGFYVHPFDVREKLGQKYISVPEYELNKCRGFYQDLLREDINMSVRLVVSCNGIKINTVRDAFEKSLRARLTRMNPDADFSCLQNFGSMFARDIPLHVGAAINFHRTTDGHLITEVGGSHIGAIQSKDLCRAFFDMYIGDIPVCEQTKQQIGKNVASIIGIY